MEKILTVNAQKDLDRMEIHQVAHLPFALDSSFLVMRVTNGWIYKWTDLAVFVPKTNKSIVIQEKIQGMHGEEVIVNAEI